jgi:hypothetical protein
MTDTCFVCLEPADTTHPFTDPLCKCKGSLQLHTQCYTRLRGTHTACPNCKTPYPVTDTEYEDGLPVKTYTDANGITHRYTYDENSMPHGCYKTYYPCGALETLCTFSHGTPTLIARKWNRRGVLIERYTYLKGVLNSYYYVWDDYGAQVEVRTYYEGALDGRTYTFEKDSTVKIKMYGRGRQLKYETCVPGSELAPYIRVDWRTAETKDLL